MSKQRRRWHYKNFLQLKYFLTGIGICVLFVVAVAGYRLIQPQTKTIYVKVKVGQGYWWANTNRAPEWFVSSLKKGEVESSLLGKGRAQIVSIRSYPAAVPNQKDVYITIKMEASYNKYSKSYSYKRSNISVSSPIELDFPSTRVTGTIIAVSTTPFREKILEKTVTLVNKGGYQEDFQYLFNGIRIGDSFFDGEEKVFEVLSKRLEDRDFGAIVEQGGGDYFIGSSERLKNIVITARMKVRQEGEKLYFGEEQKLIVNSYVPLSTDSYYFEGFVVREIN